MPQQSIASLNKLFDQIEDWRMDRKKLHTLTDILVITVCAAICGANGWVAVEKFGKAKEQWLRQYLSLPNGIPSHDTFGRVFAAMDPNVFREIFIDWVTSITSICRGEIVAIDGKTLRHSYDTSSSKAALHMVNAWATGAGISLGQLATDAKSNEITAIPKLLELLALKGCIVTIDAMGCQKAITKKIVDQKADYVISLKGNQGNLHQEVQEFFAWALNEQCIDKTEMRYFETTDEDHGRIEMRRYWVADEIDRLDSNGQWYGLRSIAMAEAERTHKGETTIEHRFFISSLSLDRAEETANAVRAHWGVENGLHWVLDVAFREDECRIRQGHADENFGIVRQIALNLLKQEKQAKVGIATKRLMAGWDETYLARVIGF